MSSEPKLIRLQKVDGAGAATGLRLTTSWGVRILLNADEVRELCRHLPDVFPQHFAELEAADTTIEDAAG